MSAAVYRSRLKGRLIALVLSLLVTIPVLAQQTNPEPDPTPQTTGQDGGTPNPSQPSNPAKEPVVRRFFRDEYRIWTSPFRAGNYDSHTMKKYGVPFLLISGALIASDRKTADLLPNTVDQATWSGRVSQLGAGYTLAGFSGSVYLIGKATGNKHAAETGFLGLEALAHSQLLVFGLKQITQRERPLDNLDNKERGGFWKGGDAFPSGHATSSFALATVFAYEYRHHIAVPITAYSIASVVAASRVSGRRHWVSDIFVGGSLGFLVGRYVYKHHHDPSLPGSPVDRKSSLVPYVGVGPRSFVLSWYW